MPYCAKRRKLKPQSILSSLTLFYILLKREKEGKRLEKDRNEGETIRDQQEKKQIGFLKLYSHNEHPQRKKTKGKREKVGKTRYQENNFSNFIPKRLIFLESPGN